MNLSFSNSYVLVTGVRGAIGLAVATKLCEAGANVIGVDLLPPLHIDQAGSFPIKTFQANLSNESEVKGLLKLIDANLITDVVCCAGSVGQVTDAENVDIDQFQECISASLTSSMLLVKYFSPFFKKRKSGNFILFSSVAGARGTALMPAYTAAKHGVVGLTRSYARELGPHGIRVNCILPGLIDSPMALEIHNKLAARSFKHQDNNDILKDSAAVIPLKRVGKPSDVANVVLFLVSELSSYCHGGLFSVDGGLLAK